MQRIGIDTTGENLAGRRHHGIVSAGQAGNRVEQNNHIAFVFHQSSGLLDNHLGNLDVTGGRLVEG